MGLVQKDAFRTMMISYAGLLLGYLNKGVLFIWFLTTEQIGLINLLVSLGLLFGNVSGFGTSFVIWKFFPFLRNREKKHHGFLTLMMLVSLIGAIVFSIVLIVFQPEIAQFFEARSASFVTYYYWIIPLGFANVFFVVFDTFLRSMYYNVISVLVYELLLRGLISILLVLYGTGMLSFDIFFVVHCLIFFIPAILLAWYMYKKDELHLSMKLIAIPRRFRKIIRSFSLFSYVNSIGGLVVTTVDAMMVAAMLGLEATGIYTTVVYLTGALQIPYRSMIRISSPLVADYWKEKDMEKMELLYKKFSSVNLVISAGLFMLVWICRVEIFHFLPPEYAAGIPVFLFLMIGRVSDMYLGLNGIIFITSKKYRYDAIFTFSLIAIVVILNLWLIPVYGVSGTALATCIAYLGYNIARLIFVWVVYRIHPFERGQVFVFLLVGIVLVFFEYVPLYAGSDILTILLKWFLLVLLFAGPIYLFRIEPEFVGYVNKGVRFVRTKIQK